MAPHLGPQGETLVNAANQSFVSAMHWAAGGSAVVALIGLAVVLAWLPKRSAPHEVILAETGPESLASADGALAERR